MVDEISHYQYHLAWIVYLISGFIFSLFIWRASEFFAHSGWCDLFRVFSLVILFTPWYVSEAHHYAAPAAMVVTMDLLLGNAGNGLAAAIAILVASAVTLFFFLLKRVLGRNNDD